MIGPQLRPLRSRQARQLIVYRLEQPISASPHVLYATDLASLHRVAITVIFSDGGSVWTISEQTLMFIPAAHKLRIDLNSGNTGVGSYGCTISGYLTTP
jgi:hypothetical protein